MSDLNAIVILTRPREAAEAFLHEFGPWPDWAEVVIAPMLEITGTGIEPGVAGHKGVIFTSQNGVAFAGAARALPAYCVGAATTRAAAEAGWDAQFAGEGSAALIQSLIRQNPPAPLLHIGGVHRRGDVARHLTEAGIRTDEIDVYDQKLVPLQANVRDLLQREVPTIVPLFSPRTARQFAQEAGAVSHAHYVAISEAVLQEVAHLPAASRSVARTANGQSLAEAMRNVLHRVETAALPQ